MKKEKAWRRRDLLLSGAAAAVVPWSIASAQGAPRRLPRYIVDCHVHIWNGGKISPTGRQVPVFSAEDLWQEMAAAGVARAVIVTPSWNPDGNEYPLEAAKNYPERFGVMGLFDISKPPDPVMLENWKKRPGMLGIQLFLASPKGRAWMTDGSADWFWPIMERANIPLMIFCAGMMPELAKIAAKYPRLKLCIDSFGIPTNTFGTAAFADYDSVLRMAKYPNVTIKIESVPFISGEPYPYRNLFPILRRTYHAFGPHRMFWGSDLTLLKTIPYRECVTFMEEIPFLSDKDLDLIMGRAISNWIGWPLPV